MQSKPRLWLKPMAAKSVGFLLTALAVTMAAAACSGKIGSNPMATRGGEGKESVSGTGNTRGTGAISGSDCAQAGMDTGATVLRRISNLEYQLTLQDLFQLPVCPLEGIRLTIVPAT